MKFRKLKSVIVKNDESTNDSGGGSVAAKTTTSTSSKVKEPTKINKITESEKHYDGWYMTLCHTSGGIIDHGNDCIAPNDDDDASTAAIAHVQTVDVNVSVPFGSSMMM